MIKKPDKLQWSKQTGFNLSWKVFDPADLLFYARKLAMNYDNCNASIGYFVWAHIHFNHLLYFARFCAGSTPKIAKKNRQQRALPGFIAISLY